MSGRFELTVRDRAAAIAFDDGGMNLLSADALVDLDAQLDRLPGELDLLCLRSAHSSVFAAGADMQEMKQFTAPDAQRFSDLGQSLFARIERLPFLTVAVIDGDCFGGALDLVLAFDLRVASRRSRFAHPGSRIGIVTGFGGTSRWRRQMDASSSRALFLGNRVLDAAEACEHGIVDVVEDDVRGRELDLATSLAVRSREDVRMVKELCRIPAGLPPEQHAAFAAALSGIYLNARNA